MRHTPSPSVPAFTAEAGAFTAANAVVAAAAVLAVVVAAGTALSGCAAPAQAPGSATVGGVTMKLAADQDSVPADGLSIVNVTATVVGAPANAVLTFQLAGPGLLSETNVEVVNGKATVELWAPFEEDLSGLAAADSKVTAVMLVEGAQLAQEVGVTFTLPTTGSPVITALTQDDYVVAGSGDSVTLVLDGRRLGSPVVTLSADPAGAVSLPATVTLDDMGGTLFHKEITVAAPAEPVEVVVTVTAEGATPVTATLHFIAVDAPAFDLTGTFAQVTYGGMKLGNLGFLDPDPQCIDAPTIALVNVEQTGSHLKFTSETCAINMPTVDIVFGVHMSTHVGPGFIRAINNHAGAPMELDLADVGPGAQFTAPPSEPTLMGAKNLAHPATDPLPTDINDTDHLADDDGDGHPGVTITGDSPLVGDQFTVSRTTLVSMTGTIESSNLVTGSVLTQSENVVLNGSGVSPDTSSLPSPWTMVRVDGNNTPVNIAGRDGDPSSVSCADVLAYVDELTAQYPAPDLSGSCNN